MLVGLVWGMLDHIKKILSATIDLNVLSEFQLITDADPEDKSLGKRHELHGWRIISTEDLHMEEAERRIKTFAVTHHIDINDILNIVEDELSRSKRPNQEPHNVIPKIVRMKAHKVTAAPIRQLFNDLKTARNARYMRILAEINSIENTDTTSNKAL
jgi:hypothetical protein